MEYITMAEIKCTINNPQDGKSYTKVIETNPFLQKRIGDTVSGNALGYEEYELLITGGSDIAGFPMRPDVSGAGRKKIFSTKGIGLHLTRKGLKTRKTIVCNTMTTEIVQINLKVLKEGKPSLAEIFAPKEEKTEV